ncbi:GNAT family N-acetyltransferase [Chloroflexota bacterium]
MTTFCAFCGGKPQYRDRHTGEYICLEHSRLEVIAAAGRPSAQTLTIRPAEPGDQGRIRELSLYFCDETDVDCFDRQYDVLACPAFLACAGDKVVGLAAYAVEDNWDAVVLVLLNVLPDYQGHGAGRALLDTVRDKAVQQGMGRILIATSNDDLPALAIYQRYGYRITAVIPGHITHHHGGEFLGFAGIPVRDEIRLEYRLEKH